MPSNMKLEVQGTKLAVEVKMSKLAKSSAGRGGVSFSNACREHRVLLKQPQMCPACGPGVPVPAANKLKAYKLGGDEYLFLEPAVVDSKKPQKGDTIQVRAVLPVSEVGGLTASDEITCLLPSVHVLTPRGDDPQTLKRYAALHTLLGSTRVGVVEIVLARGVTHGILRTTSSGALVIHELFKPDDAYTMPEVDIPLLSEAEARAFTKKGEELAEGASLLDVDLNEDPYRDEMHELILQAADGEAPTTVEEAPPEETQAEEDDLLALI